MNEEAVFLPGTGRPASIPLDRFLPPIPPGSASHWLKDNVPAGSWVLDPFGASPALAIEMARAGYRVLVAANNPIVRFLLDQLAAGPSETRLTAALAHIAAARVGEHRLEPHLLEMYHTPCGVCGTLVSADSFLWERDSKAPFSRTYHCPDCDHAGEFPTTPYDADLAKKTAATRLNIARILERVAALDDPDRKHAEEALQHYPPRAIAALGILVNKLDTFNPEDRALLSALMLVAFDRTNTLWPYPAQRPRPRRLTIPPKYHEHNVFRELERAVSAWSGWQDTAPVVNFPEEPDGDGGICIYEGPIRELAEQLGAFEIGAVLTAVPRPNQAFWTLSALWAGWLGGREAVKPFKPVLRRARYDWRWHTTALHAALGHLVPQLKPDVPVFGLVAEAEYGLLASGLVAGKSAGLGLRGLAMRTEERIAQVHWRVEKPINVAAGQVKHVPAAIDAAQKYLRARGEPARLLPIVGAVFDGLANSGFASSRADAPPADDYAKLTETIEEALNYRNGFLRYNAGKELDVGRWWLRENPETLPVSDRIEAALIDHLRQHPGCSLPEIDAALCAAFPGLLTPESDLLAAGVESYGVRTEASRWQLRAEDDPEARRRDREHIKQLLMDLGKRLGFRVDVNAHISWTDPQAAYHFHVSTTAQAGSMFIRELPAGGHNVFVLPGSRSNLLLHKRSRDPRLDYELRDWHFLKFRHLRAMAANPLLDRANLDEQLLMDELTYESPQLKLF